MFWRYATNIRHGLGMSWNLDGVPTYGETALLWGGVVVLLSYLPLQPATALVMGSWGCSVLAVAAITFAVSRNCSSAFLKNPWRTLPLVALPLACSSLYFYNATNGMETMLGVVAFAVYIGLAIGWQRGVVGSTWLGLAGFAMYLLRPEALIVADLLPVTMYCLMQPLARRELGVVLGVTGLCVAADLVGSQLYFHSALPLSFYVKVRHGYEGYAVDWHPIQSAWVFLSSCAFSFVCGVLLVGKAHWRLLVCCLVAAALTFAYLTTTLQIMGFASRYYVPYLPLIVVPSLLVVDGWLKTLEAGQSSLQMGRGLIVRVILALLVVQGFRSGRVAGWVANADRTLAGSHFIYEPAAVTIAAKEPPVLNAAASGFNGWVDLGFGDQVLRPMPPGATVASTEVGYLGVVAPHLNVIDLAGLNDTRIAIHGFDPDDLMQRKPDIILLPHPDYTYQRARILSDPRLLQQYDVYIGAEIYGVALRKDSPYREQVASGMDRFWKDRYSGQLMSDYRVQRVTWSGRKHIVQNVGTN